MSGLVLGTAGALAFTRVVMGMLFGLKDVSDDVLEVGESSLYRVLQRCS